MATLTPVRTPVQGRARPRTAPAEPSFTLSELRRASYTLGGSGLLLLLPDAPAVFLSHDVEPEEEESPCRSGPDFRWCLWYDVRYTFTPAQRVAVALLWKQWVRTNGSVPEAELLAGIGPRPDSLKALFRNGRHPAWGRMIGEGMPGTYRLLYPGDRV